MSMSHALLISLLEKPSSGFELARRFERSIGYFWHATHQQIYRELGRMEAAGWIEGQAAEDAGRTRKRVYQVLPAGRGELARWTAEPAEHLLPRDAFTLKVRAAAVMEELDLRPEAQAYMALHQARLAEYQAIEQRDFPELEGLSRRDRIQRAILQRGIRFEVCEIEWAQTLLQALE
jgi:DNA-binding PadR family transcriptional regulator